MLAGLQQCPGGEIGRHIGLKIRRLLKRRAGSIPARGTTHMQSCAAICTSQTSQGPSRGLFLRQRSLQTLVYVPIPRLAFSI